MTATKKPAGYVVTLRPERAMNDDQATRALRAFLKAALRSYGLRATSVDRAAEQPAESVTESTRAPNTEVTGATKPATA